ncbi:MULTISPECIES: DUF551 domain-containing protein [unclassified Xanthobacter]|uniref:DUF551 domain-containing protein n=1 Tax=unclassified Xanthobacter TaxID=2623496 RepID=UPI001F17EF5A|nr:MULTISPECIES: DUF551 domain-containing protein [unclassified Xanthobacter]
MTDNYIAQLLPLARSRAEDLEQIAIDADSDENLDAASRQSARTDADAAWAVVEAAERNDDWRPIATAPKDGTFMLVWNGRRLHVAAFDPVENGWISSFKTVTKRLMVEPNPTHWTPAPTPPSHTPAYSN